MKALEWIQTVLGLLAIGIGTVVLHGVLRVALRSHWAVWFMRCSLIAALAGLMPIGKHLSLAQVICMLSIYCSGFVLLAWRKFHLAGWWRAVFVFLVVAVLYLNVVFVSIHLCTFFSGFTKLFSESLSCFQATQISLGCTFAVLEGLAVTKCRSLRAQ